MFQVCAINYLPRLINNLSSCITTLQFASAIHILHNNMTLAN